MDSPASESSTIYAASTGGPYNATMMYVHCPDNLLGAHGNSPNLQSLSIDPLESNTIDLLDMVLELNAEMPAATLGVLGLPGGEETWQRRATEQRQAKAKGTGRPTPDELANVARAGGDESMRSDLDASSMDVI